MIVFIIIFIILVIFINIVNYNSNVDIITSNIDNNDYLVQDFNNKKEASNLLAQICQKLNDLIKVVDKKYPGKQCVQRLKTKFNPKNISEGSNTAKFTTYTINKGEKMVFCLRDRQTHQLHNLNLIMFVAIHELAHVASYTEGHNDEFRKNFKFLLKNAIEHNIYHDLEFDNKPQMYCGTKVTDNPLK